MDGDTKRLIKTLVLLILGIPYTFLVLILGLAFITHTFGNPEFDTTPVSYVGFAVLAATSNICFSWARTTNTNSKLFQKIRYAGELGFFSTIIFLLAALLKYFAVNFYHYNKPDPDNDLVPTVKVIYIVLFLSAYIIACICFAFILRILINKLTQTKFPMIHRTDNFDDTPPE
jgi:hypothetical protein